MLVYTVKLLQLSCWHRCKMTMRCVTYPWLNQRAVGILLSPCSCLLVRGLAAVQREAQAHAAQEAAAVALAAARSAAAERSSDVRRLSNAAVSHILGPCRSWLERHTQTLGHLVPSPAAVLTSAPGVWCSTDAPVLLRLVAAGGGEDAGGHAAAAAAAGSGGVLDASLGALLTSDLVTPALVDLLREADKQGCVLLQQRDEVLLQAMTSLLQYSLVLKDLLPGGSPGDDSSG